MRHPLRRPPSSVVMRCTTARTAASIWSSVSVAVGADSVGASELANDSVNFGEIATDAVRTAEIHLEVARAVEAFLSRP